MCHIGTELQELGFTDVQTVRGWKGPHKVMGSRPPALGRKMHARSHMHQPDNQGYNTADQLHKVHKTQMSASGTNEEHILVQRIHLLHIVINKDEPNFRTYGLHHVLVSLGWMLQFVLALASVSGVSQDKEEMYGHIVS